MRSDGGRDSQYFSDGRVRSSSSKDVCFTLALCSWNFSIQYMEMWAFVTFVPRAQRLRGYAMPFFFQ